MNVLQELNRANRERCPSFGHTLEEWALSKWGNATAGEVGELCNVIKKIERGDFTLKEANDQNLLANEAADVVIYLDLLCQRAGIDLSEAIVFKFNKISNRINSDVRLGPVGPKFNSEDGLKFLEVKKGLFGGWKLRDDLKTYSFRNISEAKALRLIEEGRRNGWTYFDSKNWFGHNAGFYVPTKFKL